MRELNFQYEFRQSIKAVRPPAYYHKLPDPSARDFIDETKTARRPFDCFCVNKNTFLAIEYKQIKEASGFPFKNIAPHQIYNLLQVTSSFNFAVVIINYRFSFNEKQKEKYEADKQKYNFAMWFLIEQFVPIMENFIYVQNKKSLPFEYVWDLYKKNDAHIIHWIKVNDVFIWDVQKILDFLEK